MEKVFLSLIHAKDAKNEMCKMCILLLICCCCVMLTCAYVNANSIKFWILGSDKGLGPTFSNSIVPNI